VHKPLATGDRSDPDGELSSAALPPRRSIPRRLKPLGPVAPGRGGVRAAGARAEVVLILHEVAHRSWSRARSAHFVTERQVDVDCRHRGEAQAKAVACL